jgi:hypothetical protein
VDSVTKLLERAKVSRVRAINLRRPLSSRWPLPSAKAPSEPLGKSTRESDEQNHRSCRSNGQDDNRLRIVEGYCVDLVELVKREGTHRVVRDAAANSPDVSAGSSRTVVRLFFMVTRSVSLAHACMLARTWTKRGSSTFLHMIGIRHSQSGGVTES